MSEDPNRPAVDLGKSPGADAQGSDASPDFDPYRFGRPEHPIAPEYAPPGYVPDPPASPYTAAQNTPTPNHYGPPAYGPPGQWGPPAPPPPAYGYPSPYQQQQQGGNGKAVAGLVLGIVSIVMFWLAFFNVIFLVLGLIFGLLGMSDAKTRQGAGRGLALAGLICTAVGFVITAVYSVWVLNLASDCGGLSNGSDPGFSQCIRDHA